MGKFRGKYRVSSTRAKWWNYAWEGDYFITICCYNFKKFPGRITKSPESIVLLSNIGKIVDEEWKMTFELHQDINLKIVPGIIMPNHFHARILTYKLIYFVINF